MADPRQLFPEQTPEGGAPLAGPDPIYLENPVLDATVRMLVELAAQVWIERERRLTLESVLAARGLLDAAAIEAFRPDAAQAAALKAERARFIEDVFKDIASTVTEFSGLTLSKIGHQGTVITATGYEIPLLKNETARKAAGIING